MTAPQGFRKAWLSWFACPRCRYRTLFPQFTAKTGTDRQSVALVYWCPSCGGLSKRKRAWLAPVLAFAVGLPAFALLYLALLGGLNVSTLLWVACVLIGMQAANLLIERIANDFVAVEHNEY